MANAIWALQLAKNTLYKYQLQKILRHFKIHIFVYEAFESTDFTCFYAFL